MTEPTEAEVERAKRCRNLVSYDVLKNGRVQIGPLHGWLQISGGFPCEEKADEALALALRPLFASIAPVLFEEAAKVCDRKSAAAIRRLAAGEVTAR